MLDWNDISYFLAVARTGSTLAASKQLKVSQATVSRRITALEDGLGTALFVRQPSGYSLSPRGSAVLPAAEAVEDAVMAFSNGVAAEARRVSGTVHVTTVESAANAWAIPALAFIREKHPDIRVEIIASDENLDLVHGQADVAIRFGERPSEQTLVVRHIIDLEEAFYASQDLVERLGMPTDLADLSRYPLVMTTNRNGGIHKWMTEHLPEAEVTHRTNSLSSIITAVKKGLGASILPCMMADEIRGLVRLLPPIEELNSQGWMVTTDQARRQPHVRVVIDALVEQIQLTKSRRSPNLTIGWAA